jgi:hypothetical protein
MTDGFPAFPTRVQMASDTSIVTKLRPFCAVALILVATTPVAGQGPAGKLPWESVRWRVGCTPEYEQTLLAEDALDRSAPGGSAACDPTDPTSAAAAARFEFEAASPWLRDLGFGGPRISERDGHRYAAKIDNYGEDADAACREIHADYDYVDHLIRLSPCFHFQVLSEGAWTKAHVWGDLYALTPVHELFHAVQHGYPGMNKETEGTWIREGTALLVQLAASRKGVVTLPYILPHRYYDIPLHIPRTTDKNDLDWKHWAYGSWYFWDFLGERLESTDGIVYLDVLFQQDLQENNGLEGIEKGLLHLGTEGLYDLYPEFVAERLDSPCYFEDLGEFDREKPGAPCETKPSRDRWIDLEPGDSTRVNVSSGELATEAFMVRTHVPAQGVGLLRVRIPARRDDPAYHLVVGPRRVDVGDPVFGRFPFGARNLYRGAVSGGRDSVLIRVANVPEDVASVSGGVGLTFSEGDIPVDVRLEVVKGVVSYTGPITGSYTVRENPPPNFSVFTGAGPHPDACTVILSLASEDASDLVMIGGILSPPLAAGRFPIKDVRTQGDASPGFSIHAIPSCELPGVNCAAGLPRERSLGGTFELTRVNEDVVEGRFRAPVGHPVPLKVTAIVEGHFVALLTNVVGGRLQPGHPCLPE